MSRRLGCLALPFCAVAGLASGPDQHRLASGPDQHRLAQDAAEITPVRAFREFDKKTWPTLPASTAIDLLQDERGVLWIATMDGLASFDGHRLRGLEGVTEAPAFGMVAALAPRSAGGLYASGVSVLAIYDQETWRSLPTPGGADALAAAGERVGRIDRDGQLWWLEHEQLPWQAWPALPEGRPRALVADVEGAFVAASAHTLYRWANSAWQSLTPPLPQGQITGLLVAKDGRYWVGTDLGELYTATLGQSSWERQQTPEWAGRIRKLTQDRRGRIWAGGLHGGLLSGLPGQPFHLWTAANGLHEDGVVALLADREGTLWISFNGRGLQQWLGEAWTHRNSWRQEAGQRRLPIFGITPAREGGFFAAVNNRGLWHWDGKTLHEMGGELGLTENVRYAWQPDDDRLWVAGRYSIWERRRGQRQFEKILALPTGFVYAILPSPTGEPHAITSSAGIFRYISGRWQRDEAWNTHLPANNVRALLWRGQQIWVGTVAGLRFFDQQRRPVEPPWQGLDNLPPSINALLDTPTGVWVGGTGGLAFCADANQTCRAVEREVLPGRSVYALALATDGSMWVGGAAGVSRLVGSTWTRYDSGNGLIEDECNQFGLLALPHGDMLVGTMASLARFDATVEPLASPDLRLFWREPDTPTHTSPDERSVVAAWQAPWLLPEALEYRFRLPHRKADGWWLQSRDERTFENLGPGRWQVEIQARRVGQTTWSEPISRQVWIAPTFTESQPFYWLCGLTSLLAVAALVRWRTHRLRQQAHELQLAVDKHVANLKMLRGLLPICSSCKKVRDDAGAWQQLEIYMREHSEAEFSHGYCPDCFNQLTRSLDHLDRH